MEKNPPNQIVNLQNNFILSQNLFLLILKEILPVQVLRSNRARVFAPVSTENIFAFSTKKVKIFNADLRLSQQKLSTTPSNVKNVHNLLCTFQPSICLYSKVIKNHDEKPPNSFSVIP